MPVCTCIQLVHMYGQASMRREIGILLFTTHYNIPAQQLMKFAMMVNRREGICCLNLFYS